MSKIEENKRDYKSSFILLTLISIVAIVAIVAIVNNRTAKLGAETPNVIISSQEMLQDETEYSVAEEPTPAELKALETEAVEKDPEELTNIGGKAAIIATDPYGCKYEFDNKDAFITGKVSDGSGREWWDYCEGDTLIEFYCDRGIVRSTSYKCDFCVYGACTKCWGSTEQDITKKEVVYQSSGDPNGGRFIVQWHDRCMYDGLHQFYCIDRKDVGSFPSGIGTQCACRDGVCPPENAAWR